MLKTKTWIILSAVLLTVCIAATALLAFRSPGTCVVEVLQDGRLLKTIDLSQVRESYRFVVEDPAGGCNTVLVEPGRICICEADCPDQICVRRGWLPGHAAPIVCLPHRLVIRSAEATAPDAVSR